MTEPRRPQPSRPAAAIRLGELLDGKRRDLSHLFSSQASLAKAAKFSANTISALIRAERPVPWETVSAIAETLDDDPHWLALVLRQWQEAERGWGRTDAGPDRSPVPALPVYDDSHECRTQLLEGVLNHRRTAISLYDSGQRDACQRIYQALLRSLIEHPFLGDGYAYLTRSRAVVAARAITVVRRSSPGSEVIAMRMALDGFIEVLTAALRLDEVRHDFDLVLSRRFAYTGQRLSARNPFGPLLQMMTTANQLQVRGLLCEACETAIRLVEPRFSDWFFEQPEMHIHDAITRRILRWPGLDLPCPRDPAPRQPFDPTLTSATIQDPVSVLWDLFALEMYNFSLASLGLSIDDLELIYERGTAYGFDQALTKRGYPRDGNYWDRLCP